MSETKANRFARRKPGSAVTDPGSGALMTRRPSPLAAGLALAFFAAGCARTVDHSSELAYRQEIEKWRGDRLARLTSPDGWLTLAGLFWLEEGANSVGSSPSAKVVLPAGKAPPQVGTLLLEKRVVRFLPAAGVGSTVGGAPAVPGVLQSDAGGRDPTAVVLGTLSFYVIQRGDRLGVRVKDSESPARKDFKGIDHFPVDPAWRVEARFEPADRPKKIDVPTVLGTVEEDESPGAFVFRVKRKAFRLDPVVEEGSKDLFIIFGDETNGKETDGAGRFVYAPWPRNGRTVIDFNRAYNPPCAFTPYATCPLPPPQNRLPIRVEAGEKNYESGRHGR